MMARAAFKVLRRPLLAEAGDYQPWGPRDPAGVGFNSGGLRVEFAPRRRGTEAVTTAPIRNRLRALRPYEGSNPSLSATPLSCQRVGRVRLALSTNTSTISATA